MERMLPRGGKASFPITAHRVAANASLSNRMHALHGQMPLELPAFNHEVAVLHSDVGDTPAGNEVAKELVE
jgi:hypothetical protein